MEEQQTDLDVRLDLDAEFLEVLDDGAVDRAAEVGVLVGDDARLVADGVVHVLFVPRSGVVIRGQRER